MPRERFVGGQANSFEALKRGENGELIVDNDAPEKTLENVLPPVEVEEITPSESVEITDVLDSDEEHKPYLGDDKSKNKRYTPRPPKEIVVDPEGRLESETKAEPVVIPDFNSDQYRQGMDSDFNKGKAPGIGTKNRTDNQNEARTVNPAVRPPIERPGRKPPTRPRKFLVNKEYPEDHMVVKAVANALATEVFDEDENVRPRRTKGFDSLQEILNDKYPETFAEEKDEEERKNQEDKRAREIERAKKVAAKSAEVLRLMENSELSGQGEVIKPASPVAKEIHFDVIENGKPPKVDKDKAQRNRPIINVDAQVTRNEQTRPSAPDKAPTSAPKPTPAPKPATPDSAPTPKPKAPEATPEPTPKPKAPAARVIHFDSIENGKTPKVDKDKARRAPKDAPTIDIDAEVIGNKPAEPTPTPVATPSPESRARPAQEQQPYVEPKGIFARAGNWIVDKIWRPISEGTKKYAAFQAERVASFGGIIKAEFLGNRQLVKREGFIAEHKIADNDVNQILAAMNSINEYRNTNQLSPRQAKRAEKDSQNLRKQLTSAQERRAEAYRKVQFHEGKAMVQENKKKNIAENFAHIVNERLSPVQEKFDSFMEKKADLNNEITIWSEKLASETEQLKVVKEAMKTNRYLNTSTDKARVKAIENSMAQAYSDIKSAKERLSKLDARIVKVKTVLDIWDNKKQAYNRYAKESFKPYDGVKKVAPNPQQYRDPTGTAIPDVTSASAEEDSSMPDSNTADTTGSPEDKEKIGEYTLDKWSKEWNRLYGSKIKIEPRMFTGQIEIDKPLGINQFSVLVRNAHRASKDPNKGKINGNEFAQVLKDLQK